MTERPIPDARIQAEADRASGMLEAAVVLRMLHCRGLPRHGVLPLWLDGCGMGDALSLGDAQLDEPMRRDADRCRIAWRSQGWTLSNDSRLMICALNGRRIPTGAEVVLQIGNVLELGLTRFVLEADRPGLALPYMHHDAMDSWTLPLPVLMREGVRYAALRGNLQKTWLPIGQGAKSDAII